MRILLLLACLFGLTAARPIDWWDVPRHGGNSFNLAPPDQGYFDALAGYGADWVRLAPDKWKGAHRDFLIGDADKYTGIPPADLATLQAVLARAHKAKLKVVISPLSLPWLRWIQNNGNQYDGRLWQDKAHWDQAVAFWRDLATALKGNPAIGAYNLINEPTPEKGAGLDEHGDPAAGIAWYAANRGTARDLPAFYRAVIAAIRAVDPDTPIMLDSGWYAAADAFYWPGPLEDPALLYAFHMYEPWTVTSAPNLKRAVPIPYPGMAPFQGRQQMWDAARVAAYLGQPIAWADAHGIPRNRMVAAEFGCIRRLAFCPAYLEDVLTALDRSQVHWAFYSFREDAWDAMDYELGPGAPPPGYWDNPAKAKRGPTPQFEPILRRLRAH
ncbi:MAG: cellulase family glycosylhydrolase [Pseudomonadota bacterium]